MAENRCEYCGKNNPDHLENCLYCQAQLVTDPEADHDEDTVSSADEITVQQDSPLDSAGDDSEEAPAESDADADTVVSAAEEDKVPAWLAALTKKSEEATQSTPSDEDLESEADEAEEEASTEEDQEAELQEDAPEWLRAAIDKTESSLEETTAQEIEVTESSLEEETPTETEAPDPEEPDSTELGDDDAEIQAWIDQVARESGSESLDDLDPEMESWLLDKDGTQVEAGLPEEDVPDWLHGFDEKPESDSETVETKLDFDKESDLTSPEKEQVEKSGPLAGLRNVLKAEPLASQSGIPLSQFGRLSVTESQQEKVDRFQKMIDTEAEPRPVDPVTDLPEQKLLRYLVALLLALSVIFSSLYAGNLKAFPAHPSDSGRLSDMVSRLTEDSIVLLVLDYQPGLSAEIHAAAEMVLKQVVARNASAALVSTSPTGPALGEALMKAVDPDQTYLPGRDYVNLGYLPGEASGMQFFARSPRAAALLAYDARPIWTLIDSNQGNPWDTPILQNVNTVSDFSMTLLLSDDPDTIRNWIEQVEPALRPLTLAVVASSQAEPLVRPYFNQQFGQVAALQAGLQGGASYEMQYGQAGSAVDRWDSYSLSLLLVVILILATGSYNLLLLWKDREAEKSGGSK